VTHGRATDTGPTAHASSAQARHRGPSLILVASVHALLYLAASALLAGRQPSPFAPAGAFLQLGSALTLGIFVASATSRVQFLGMKSVAGLYIALFGGFTSSILLALSAFVQWALAHASAGLSSGAIQAFHLVQFAAGGPGCVAAMGLFVAGIALTAGIQGFAPRWLMVTGLGIAGAAELSSLVFILPQVAILLPIARFTSLAWMLCIAAILPKRKF
jgi:hypothetical protein